VTKHGILNQLSLKVLLVGITSLGTIALTLGQDAKAACLGGNSVCETFNPTSVSNVVDRTGFTGTFSPDNPYVRARVGFSLSGSWATPVTLSNIFLKGQGITTPLSFGDFQVDSVGSNRFTNFILLDSSVSNLDFTYSSISFDMPANSALDGAQLQAFIQYQDSNQFQTNTSSGNFLTTAVPGPLPLLGLGAAIGYSRKLRRSIK
jgi:hypothetical protein